MSRPAPALTGRSILVPAIAQAFVKLDPRAMARNPVMFVVEIVAGLTTLLLLRDIFMHRPHLGFSLIGHGRATAVVWDGEAGGRMFWTRHGMPMSRFVGISWDGRNKAAVGFDHSVIVGGIAFNDLYFETEVRHQYEAYRNFTEAGIRVGKTLVKAVPAQEIVGWEEIGQTPPK